MSHLGYMRDQQRRLAERTAGKHKEKHMSEMFAAPSAPSGGIVWADHKGALLLIEPHSVETGIQTSYGAADAVRADVTVIDGPGAGETHTDVLVFPKVLQSQLRAQVGVKVLGRLGSGTAKPGQSAPHLLNEASADDIAKAEAWVAENAKSSVTTAAPPF